MQENGILVILYAPTDFTGIRQTIQSALQTAVSPARLTFALPSYAQREASDFLGKNRVRSVFFHPGRNLSALAEYAPFFLLIMGSYVFLQGWDSLLLLEYQEARNEKLLLTASIWTAPNGEAEVCFPALCKPFDENGVSIGRGMPLVCPKLPISTLLIDPALLFGGTEFLRDAQPEITALSYQAYVAGYNIHLLSRVYLYPLTRLPERRLKRPYPKVRGGTSADRFEKSCGIHWEEKTFSYKAAYGLSELQNTYPQRLPLHFTLQQRLQALKAQPLIVTGFIDFPRRKRSPMSYCLSYSFLCRLQALPQLVFTGGEKEGLIRSLQPNHQSFRERDLRRYDGMSVESHFRYSKIMMIRRASECTPSVTHLAWVDFDILPHPLPELAVPSFSGISDNTIHLATVNGVPDTSFLFIPKSRIKMLVLETTAALEMDDILHRGYSETGLWQKIIARHPGCFTLHPMPKRQLLFLSCFDPRLLSKQITVYFQKGK